MYFNKLSEEISQKIGAKTTAHYYRKELHLWIDGKISLNALKWLEQRFGTDDIDINKTCHEFVVMVKNPKEG